MIERFCMWLTCLVVGHGPKFEITQGDKTYSECGLCGARKRKAFTLVELIVVIAIVGILASILIGGCSCISYGTSSGYRDGYIQKVSHKNGYTTSSWEMEVAMPGFGGTIQNKLGQNGGNVWECSLPDNDVLKEAQAVDATQLVRIHYDEKRWNWPHWTNYLANKIEVRHAQAEK